MEKYSDLSKKESEELKSIFTKSVELTKAVFSERALRRFIGGSTWDPDSLWENNKMNSLFDIIIFGTQDEKSQIIPLADSIREELIWLMTSSNVFIDAISGSATYKKEKIYLKILEPENMAY